VIMATSIEPVRTIAPDVLRHSRALDAAVEHVKTVATVGMQLWTVPSTEHMGWRSPPPLLTSYGKPFDTWADMSHTLALEDWGPIAPRSVQYFCGALPEAQRGQVPDAAGLESIAARWLRDHAAELWPAAVVKDRRLAGGAGDLPFKPGVLFGVKSIAPAGLQDQWLIANVEPAERYVQSLPGSTRHRIRADETGVPGLLVAGDWLRTGLDYGCVESAVIGGLQAARAICGYPAVIHGESDFTPSHARSPA
jgi:hypothetical protein